MGQYWDWLPTRLAPNAVGVQLQECDSNKRHSCVTSPRLDTNEFWMWLWLSKDKRVVPVSCVTCYRLMCHASGPILTSVHSLTAPPKHLDLIWLDGNTSLPVPCPIAWWDVSDFLSVVLWHDGMSLPVICCPVVWWKYITCVICCALWHDGNLSFPVI